MWTHIVLYFFIGLVVASAVSAASYFLGQWFRRVKPSWAKPVDYVLALLSIPILGFSLVIVVPLCIVGANAARANDERRDSAFFYFVRSLSSTTLAFAFPLLVMLEVSLYGSAWITSVTTFFAPWFTVISEVYSLLSGVYLGIVATPSVIPISLWIWQGSKVRPGFDRPLREGDATQ